MPLCPYIPVCVKCSERRSNLRLMQELGLVGRLLHILNDSSISLPTLRAVAALLTILLSPPVHAQSLVRYCQQCSFLFLFFVDKDDN